MNKPRNPCPGGGRNAAEPGAVTGYNGEHVRCGHCHRRMKLDRDGKVPAHNLPDGRSAPVDLGHDLEGYDDDEPPRPARPAQPEPRFNSDGSATIPLADLQAAGFNHGSPYGRGSIPWQSALLKWMLDEPCGPLLASTWLPGEPDEADPPAPTVPGQPIFLGYRQGFSADYVQFDEDRDA